MLNESIFYERLREFGFAYGPAFQTGVGIDLNEEEALPKIRAARIKFRKQLMKIVYTPCIMDGALRTVMGPYIAGDVPALLKRTL